MSLRNLSYSGVLLLHSCPKKFQLSKLGVKSQQYDFEADELDFDSQVVHKPEAASDERVIPIKLERAPTLHFAYGTAVGNGIQGIIEGRSYDSIIWELFLAWPHDLYAENAKKRESFSFALLAIEKFALMRKSGYLADYELATFNGKPAVELSFRLDLGRGFKYRGFVDVVLRNKITGRILVLELKTNGSTNINPAQYKNSAQAIGYSLILDTIEPAASEYSVIYLIYSKPSLEYVEYKFPKSLVQRALWIQELLLETKKIELYEETGVWPMHGESCFQYYSECQFYGICTLDAEMLANPNGMAEDDTQYTIELSIAELLQKQLDKEALLDT